MTNFIISVTTIPSRIHHLYNRCKELLEQTYPASKIILNIPKKCRRTGETYIIPENLIKFLNSVENTVINYTKDYGPATKLLGLIHYKELSKLPENTIIIVIDDDMKYPKNLLEKYNIAYNIDKNKIYSFGGGQIISYDDKLPMIAWKKNKIINFIEGYLSWSISIKYFKKCINDFFKIQYMPKQVFLADDLYLSNIISKHRITMNKLDSKGVEIKQCDYSRGSDALHYSVVYKGNKKYEGCSGNLIRYRYVIDFLIKNNIFYFS